MSGTRPTLNEYFTRARKDEVLETEPTLDLLLEYKAKADRRRKKRAVVITAFSCLLLGAIGIEFSTRSAAPEGSIADARSTAHSANEAGQQPRNTTPQATAQPLALAQQAPVRSPGSSRPILAETSSNTSSSEGIRATSTRKGGTMHEQSFGTAAENTTVDATAMREDIRSKTTDEQLAERAQAIAVSNADPLPVPTLVQPIATAQDFIAPPEQSNIAVVLLEDKHEPVHTLALTVGAHYGTATSDISSINEQLAEFNFPTLRQQYQQTTIQAGIAIKNVTVGIAYTTPYTESVVGNHLPVLMSNNNTTQPSVTTTFSHKRWSTYGEYSLVIADNIRLDAGAQVSFTSYELGFESNYTPSLGLTPNEDPTDSGQDDLWTTMWRNISPPDATSNLDEKVWAEHALVGMSTQSVGISPTVGLSWRALPALNLQCKVSYMFNMDHEWRLTSIGTPVNSASDKLRMNEYSISIGASFYQWLF